MSAKKHPQPILIALTIFVMIVIVRKIEQLDVNEFSKLLFVIVPSWTIKDIVKKLKNNKGEHNSEKSN